jgi:hypothetical protein
MLLSQRNAYCTDTISAMSHLAPTDSSDAVPQLKLAAIYLWAGIVSIGCSLFAGIDKSRQRKALSELDDRLLDDIGVTRLAAAREAKKFFWQK